MTLESITLQNFQSWEKQTIHFSPGFNAIIGDSDSGKSAIERAIRWVVENRPSGDDFVSWFAESDKSTFVKLRFTDNFVTRKKDGKKNIYKTKDLVLEAFKSEVPDEIKSIINMQEYNIQSQHKKYFLLQETPGERARILNQAVGLDIIDSLFSHINEKTLELNRNLKRVLETKKNLEDKLQEYQNLDKIEEIIYALQKKADFLKFNNSKINRSSEILTNMKAIDAKSKTLKKWLEIQPEYDVLTKKTALYDEIAGKKLKAEEKLSSIKDIQLKTQQLGKTLKSDIEKYLSILSKNKLCPVCNSTITKSTIKEIENKLCVH
jgi:DNA repair protein SbcC/Rad50